MVVVGNGDVGWGGVRAEVGWSGEGLMRWWGRDELGRGGTIRSGGRRGGKLG